MNMKLLSLRIFFLGVFACSMMLASTAVAQKLEYQFTDWNVFTLTQEGKRICYITSNPSKKSGNYRRRGEPYFIVTHRGKDLAEISTSSGYEYKEKSQVDLTIDKLPVYKLFTSIEQPKIAWASDAKQDKDIIEHLMKGDAMKIRGTSSKDTFSEDTYSLKGFTKAYKQMLALCKSNPPL